uniref:Ig-like domain-containing protein n=1 Tax=Oncorhynchus tshawytscha TaxID=74940 RepID=A0AAZ3Q5B0_ONCTS
HAPIILCQEEEHSTSVEDIITPDRDVVDDMDGCSVQLSCTYNSSLTNSLLWYLQHPGSSPQFLILDYSGIITNTDKKTRVDLMISSVELEDSALYHCIRNLCLEDSGQ